MNDKILKAITEEVNDYEAINQGEYKDSIGVDAILENLKNGHNIETTREIRDEVEKQFFHIITQCQCGSTEFYVREKLWHDGTIDPETGTLDITEDRPDGIDKIVCQECDKEYDEENFKAIEWN